MASENDGAVLGPYLGAADLAALCGVDLKSIHNWVGRGALPCFRTPGRHLRFRAPDVARFLEDHGYAVPPELAATLAPRVAVLGSTTTRVIVRAILADRRREPILVPHAVDALVLAGARRFEVLVTDWSVAPPPVLCAMVGAMRAARRAMRIVVVGDGNDELPVGVACSPPEIEPLTAALAAGAPRPGAMTPRRLRAWRAAAADGTTRRAGHAAPSSRGGAAG